MIELEHDSLTERFKDALQYAVDLHKGQFRKGTNIPYVAHLLAVAATVFENGGDEEQAIAGLLHDAVEDQGGLPRLEEIRSKYGERVAGIVKSCTDAYEDPKPPWKKRKMEYVASIQSKRRDAIVVSLADKLHNARAILADYRTIGEDLWDRFNGGREGTLWYYRSIVGEFQKIDKSPLMFELELTVAALESLAKARSRNGSGEDNLAPPRKTKIGPYHSNEIVLCSADAGPGSQCDRPEQAQFFFPGAKWVGALRNAAERLHCDFLILTTQHGLVEPNTIITPYDLHINQHRQEVTEKWIETIPAILRGAQYRLMVFYAGGCPRAEMIEVMLPLLKQQRVALISFGRPNMYDVGKVDRIWRMLMEETTCEEIKSILRFPDGFKYYLVDDISPSTGSKNEQCS